MRYKSTNESKPWKFRLPALAAVLVLAAPFAPAQMQTVPAQIQTVNTPPADAIAITVTRFGPYPNTITHANTPFVLDVSNRSGLLEDTYSLLPAVRQTGVLQGTAQQDTTQPDSTQPDATQPDAAQQSTGQRDTAPQGATQPDTTQQSTAQQPSVPHLLDLHSTQTQPHDHQTIQLAPGNYQLQFYSHPDWVVNITITAN
jgi:hypothetical protein